MALAPLELSRTPYPLPYTKWALYIYFLARGRVIKFRNFRMNWRATAVWHYQAVEPQHHGGMALDSSRPLNLLNMTGSRAFW